MSLQLNPAKAARNMAKGAFMGTVGEPLRTGWRQVKLLGTGHPVEAIKEAYRGFGRQLSALATVLSLGTYKGVTDKSDKPMLPEGQPADAPLESQLSATGVDAPTAPSTLPAAIPDAPGAM